MSEPYTVEQAQALGFSEAELELLREAGLIETRLEEPWQPQTLEDVSWLIGRMRALRTEREIVASQARKRIERSEAAESALLARYGEQMRAIVEENLPRKRDGSYARKSLDLLDGKVGIRATRGGTAITDQEALLAYIKERRAQLGDAVPSALLDAVSVTERLVGAAAVDRLLTDGEWQVKVAVTPLRQLIETGVPDPKTGEVKPVELPGVEVLPPDERLYWE